LSVLDGLHDAALGQRSVVHQLERIEHRAGPHPGLTNDLHRLPLGLLARPGGDDLIGVASAIWPEIWMRAFSADPAVIGTGVAYLKTVGPFFGFFGMGYALYCVGQGAKRMEWPVLAQLRHSSTFKDVSD
jgi:hypothetical protein